MAAAIALASAVAAGWSTALMHYGASSAGHGVGAAELARHVLSEWRWRLGVVASLVGLALHATALHLGSLTIVQPLAVTALFFSMVFRDLLDHRPPPPRTVAWGAITAVGLGLFLTAAGPTGGDDAPDGRAAAWLTGLGVLGVLVALRASGRFPRHAGLLLGTAGGIVFGLMAGAIKSTTSAWSTGDLFTSWPLYVMVCVGLSGFLLNQHIYNRTRVTESLPMLNLVNPLVALTFGIAVFAERPSGSPLSLALECVGLGVVLMGIFVLGRIGVDESEGSAAGGSRAPGAPSHPARGPR
ncbi:DMT family transporter [Nocardioides sp. YIM 152315]|uniref:DMT family transporter n=1 Tax=Nocardioides sp. YIM 152315 TaxID=3031760 RepID=UPI0023D9B7A1|nr:DMT family transporter [Nocardioides sp. YIM 152315]MDF1606000.1 DMT family transporter [Nocardioides sp. YIM 152315]